VSFVHKTTLDFQKANEKVSRRTVELKDGQQIVQLPVNVANNCQAPRETSVHLGRSQSAEREKKTLEEDRSEKERYMVLQMRKPIMSKPTAQQLKLDAHRQPYLPKTNHETR
jgi:hypothetical protein